jgi:GWxTD domain-containing protein
VQISGIEFVQNAEKANGVSASSKAGYELLPLPINVFPTSENKLMYYAEMYNMKKVLGDSSQYLLRTYIEEVQTGRKMAGMLYQKRMDSRDVEAFLHQYDITSLPTGAYFLVVEMKDRENNVIGMNKVYFERWNDNEQEYLLADIDIISNSFVGNYTSIDSLRENIRSLRPISTAAEKNFVDKNLTTADLETLQKFFYNFWYQRNEVDPRSEWVVYCEQVRIVNANFGSKIRKGYETERGRVYLQYGAPNTITDVPHEPAVYPYQIWHYYSVHNQSNRKFIFVNFDLVTNDFELLHSDVTGEVYDIRWNQKLLRRNYTTNDLDEQDPDFGWGSKVNEFFDTPH